MKSNLRSARVTKWENLITHVTPRIYLVLVPRKFSEPEHKMHIAMMPLFKHDGRLRSVGTHTHQMHRSMFDITSMALMFVHYRYKFIVACASTEHHAMKAYWGRGRIARLILDLGTRWRRVVSFTPRPLYPQGKSHWYSLDRRLGEPQSRSWRGVEEKNLQPLTGLEPPIIQPVAHCYTTELSRFQSLVWKKMSKLTFQPIHHASGNRQLRNL
jgi:hypothetical protein